MSPDTIVIKKYGNRRLYDTTHSQLHQPGRSRAGWCATAATFRWSTRSRVRICTRAVLTQIVVEQAKGEDSAFPLDVLRQMIVASGRATNDAALT